MTNIAQTVFPNRFREPPHKHRGWRLTLPWISKRCANCHGSKELPDATEIPHPDDFHGHA